jgi:hypothetical protein
MTPEPPDLETELRGLRATALDENLLLRLEACANGSLLQSTPQELSFEAELREIRPSPLRGEFLAEMEKIFHEVPFPVNDKIVLFPKASHPAAAERSRRSLPRWSAAAAVALIGAASAMLMPTTPPTSGIAVAKNAPARATPSGGSLNVAPASFNRDVSEVNDEGIVWRGDNQPHNVVRVVYKDKITAKDANGRSYQIEQPREEFLLIPARTD